MTDWTINEKRKMQDAAGPAANKGDWLDYAQAKWILDAAEPINRARIAEQILTAVPIPWVTIYHGDETSSLATATYQDGWNAAVNAVLALLRGES